MARKRSSPRALACAILVLASMWPATAATAQSIGSWTPISSPHVPDQNERPQAVVALASDDVWAIGYHLDYFAGTFEFRTLAEHFDGSSVVVVPTPDREGGAPARDFLNGATGVASNDVWAVGTSVGIGSPDQTLIEHWDGTSWSLVDSPNPGALSDDLQAADATSATDVWAVGARINTGHFYQVPMTMHWNGVAWTVVRAPNPYGCTGHSYLTAVTALRPNSAWATGWCGSGGSAAERGYVLHWDGQRWSTVVIIPQRAAPSSETYGIAASGPNNIWVVGSYRRLSDATTVPLIYHFDGVKWAVVPAPAQAIVLQSITLGAGGGAWTVGAGNSPQPPFAGPSAAKRTTTGWADRPLPISFGRLNAVTTAPDGVVWAVGMQILDSGDDTALIVHR